MATKTNQVFAQIGDEVIELKGAELEALLQTQKEMQEQLSKEKTQLEAKQVARQALLEKLGITADEAKLLLG